MQVTIDSSEPLEKVLPVVAALYGVELAVSVSQTSSRRAPSAPPTKKTARRRRGRNTTEGARAATTRRTGRTRGSKPPDPVAVRTWARAHGYEVKDRGRVPAAVIAAYLGQGVSAS